MVGLWNSNPRGVRAFRIQLHKMIQAVWKKGLLMATGLPEKSDLQLKGSTTFLRRGLRAFLGIRGIRLERPTSSGSAGHHRISLETAVAPTSVRAGERCAKAKHQSATKIWKDMEGMQLSSILHRNRNHDDSTF